MFSPELDPIAIDNTANSFETATPQGAQRFSEYTKAVTNLVSTTAARLEATNAHESISAHPALEGVRTFFLNGQGSVEDATFVPGLQYDIGDDGTREVERGFLDLVGTIQSHGQFVATLERIEAEVTGELCWAVAAGTVRDVTRIRASFFAAVAGALTSGLVDNVTT